MLIKPRSLRRGFTLIELMVTIVLVGILLVMAIPAFGRWIADAHVRAAAESLVNAIRVSQATAVARGRTSMFALTVDTPPVYRSPAQENAPNWYAALNPLSGSDETGTTLGLILKSTEGTQHAVAISGPALTCFNAMGRQVSLAATATSLSSACTAPSDDVTSPTTYRVSRKDASRSFNVLVYLGGRVRMCDAAKTLSGTNPDGC